MSLDTLIFVYLVVVLGGLSGVGLYYERRRKLFGPAPSKDRVFRCEKCAFVYTDDADVDRSRCPHCGTTNAAVRF
jgi:DNA-directed RNA polymerase subunit RPC12/RpoP